jgi:hypothetical protein
MSITIRTHGASEGEIERSLIGEEKATEVSLIGDLESVNELLLGGAFELCELRPGGLNRTHVRLAGIQKAPCEHPAIRDKR